MKTILIPVEEYIPDDPNIINSHTVLITHRMPTLNRLLTVDVHAHDLENSDGSYSTVYELGYYEGDSQYGGEFLKKFIEDIDYGVYIVEVSTNVSDFVVKG